MSRRTFARLSLATMILLASLSTAQAEVTQADVDAYNKAADAHNERVRQYEAAAADFNVELAAYNSDRDWYNSLTPEQRTQFQYDRLARWYETLSNRKVQLDAEYHDIERCAADLADWLNSLN